MQIIKRILLLAIIMMISVQFSCTTKATSAEIKGIEVQEATQIRNVGSSEFSKLIEEKSMAVIIDVRTPQEVSQGYIAGAKNIDINSQGFRSEVAKLDKSQPVLVYCRSGRRSAAAMRYMRDQGFSEVYNLEGGVIAWSQAGMSLTK